MSDRTCDDRNMREAPRRPYLVTREDIREVLTTMQAKLAAKPGEDIGCEVSGKLVMAHDAKHAAQMVHAAINRGESLGRHTYHVLPIAPDFGRETGDMKPRTIIIATQVQTNVSER